MNLIDLRNGLEYEVTFDYTSGSNNGTIKDVTNKGEAHLIDQRRIFQKLFKELPRKETRILKTSFFERYLLIKKTWEMLCDNL